MFTVEVNDAIADKQDFPVTLSAAKTIRQQLIEDRAYVTVMGNDVDCDEKNEWFHRKLNFKFLYI